MSAQATSHNQPTYALKTVLTDFYRENEQAIQLYGVPALAVVSAVAALWYVSFPTLMFVGGSALGCTSCKKLQEAQYLNIRGLGQTAGHFFSAEDNGPTNAQRGALLVTTLVLAFTPFSSIYLGFCCGVTFADGFYESEQQEAERPQNLLNVMRSAKNWTIQTFSYWTS